MAKGTGIGKQTGPAGNRFHRQAGGNCGHRGAERRRQNRHLFADRAVFSPDAGQIRLGAVPIEKLDLTAWRRAISHVSQESPIMSGTIRENICYGLGREAGEDEIRKAALLANAAEFIEKLPAGYETEVDKGG